MCRSTMHWQRVDQLKNNYRSNDVVEGDLSKLIILL